MLKIAAVGVTLAALASLLAAVAFFAQRSVLFPAPAFTGAPVPESAELVLLDTSTRARAFLQTRGISQGPIS